MPQRMTGGVPVPPGAAMSAEADALLAVVAHGLLNAVVPAVGAADLLGNDDLRPEIRAELVAMLQSRLGLVVATLQDLVRGVPLEVLEVLEGMAPPDA